MSPWRIILLLCLLLGGSLDAFALRAVHSGTPCTGDFGGTVSRARYYKPDLGRFWTMDTVEGDKQDPLSLHKYLYCADNPVNLGDPSGNEYGINGMLGVTFSQNAISQMTPLAAVAPYAAAKANLMELDGFTPAERAVMLAALQEARNYADDAVKHLQGISYSYVTARYVRWFGSRDESRIERVKDTWSKIHAALWTVLTFENGKPWYSYGRKMDYFGSTRPLATAIRLGTDFWAAPLTDEDSKAGTIIHELSHKFAGTGDKEYGSRECRALAVLHPDKAVKNADSYAYFVEIK